MTGTTFTKGGGGGDMYYSPVNIVLGEQHSLRGGGGGGGGDMYYSPVNIVLGEQHSQKGDTGTNIF